MCPDGGRAGWVCGWAEAEAQSPSPAWACLPADSPQRDGDALSGQWCRACSRQDSQHAGPRVWKAGCLALHFSMLGV